MLTNLNAYNQAEPTLSSEIPWDKLYHFLGDQVRDWVFSSHISLWKGQEEDIIADIVQEAILKTFIYSSEHRSWSKGDDGIPYKSFQQISRTIARKQYNNLRRQDNRLIYVPLSRPLPQRHAILYEQFDTPEIADEVCSDTPEIPGEVYQEWPFDSLVPAVVDFPDEERTALLVNLANRTMYDEVRYTKLEQAFLEVGFRLQDYRHSLPDSSVGHSSQTVPQQFTNEQPMKQRQLLKEQGGVQIMKNCRKPVLRSKGFNPHYTEGDRRITTLAMYLDRTAPGAPLDPVFQEGLCDKLLGILANHSAFKMSGTANNELTTLTDRGEETEIASMNHGLSLLPGGQSSDGTEKDPGITTLAMYLDRTAPGVPLDPVFREELCDKLLGILANHPASDKVNREASLNCFVYQIANFPEDERAKLLTDLANRTPQSEAQATKLKQAFLDAGIRLQDYQPLLPHDPSEQKKHIFLLDCAYKRLVKLQDALLGR